MFSSAFDFRLIEKVQQQGLYLFDTIPFFYQINLCIDLIQTMEKHGLEPSTNTFEPLIIFFARILDMSKVVSSILMKCFYSFIKCFENPVLLFHFLCIGLAYYILCSFENVQLQSNKGFKSTKSFDWID